jgi:glucose/arabinose dehydrogenase
MKFFPSLRLLWTLALFIPIALVACSDDDDGEEEPEVLPFGLTTEVVTPANNVGEMVFLPDGRMLFAEQYTGTIRVLGADGVLEEAPFAQLEVANWLDLDWGLTGLAADPNFADNHYVYAFYTKPLPTPASDATPESEQADTPTPESDNGGPPAVQTAPSGEEEQPELTPVPGGTEGNPIGQPVLVRFTEVDGVGQELTIISDDFPVTPQIHAGYNANGNIHFGPDGLLYLNLGDYDTADEALSLDLSSPIGKLLRIDPETGEGPDDNPYVNESNADPRVFAIGFREPFDFAFHPESEAIYGTDNTPYTCEELNIVRGGQNYGWPDVGEFPFAECGAGDQVQAIYYFAREGLQPGEYLSLVEITGLTFVPADLYPALGDSLFVCEGQRSVVADTPTTGVLRRLVLSGDFTDVSADVLIARDCRGDLETGPDGSLYYANASEIRKLLPGTTADASATVAAPTP